METYETQRQAMMLSQLRPVGVADPRVLMTMASLARERFVPEVARPIAYADVSIPLGHGLVINPPAATALLFERAAIAPDERVLVIGGLYAIAIAGSLAHDVTGLIDPLFPLQVPVAGARILSGPLDRGVPGSAPYDVILIDGAIESLPEELVGQLREGGRLITGVIERGTSRLAEGVQVGGAVVLKPFAEREIGLLPAFAHVAAFAF